MLLYRNGPALLLTAAWCMKLTLFIFKSNVVVGLQRPVYQQRYLRDSKPSESTRNEFISLTTPSTTLTDYPPGTIVCILPSGNASTTATECSTGELFLIGQYVHLGINNVGSFGTSSIFKSSYHTGKLDFIADYVRNGFASTPAPGFAGDYFATFLPVEGWLTQYQMEGTNGYTYTVLEGLMGRADTPPSEIHVSSSEGRLSVLWLARFGALEVRKVIQLQTDQLYFTTSVVVKNIGTKPITSFYYARTVDPGQEGRFYNTYATRNYVKYQPRSTAGATTINYEHPSDPNTAMVCAAGVNNPDFFLAMGAINSHARVSHLGTQIFQARQAYIDNKWKSYGGNDVTAAFSDSGRMKTADEAIHLAFLYSAILPGEVVSFQYSHVVHENDLIPALRSLQEVQIVQPTDAISGQTAGISAVIQHSDLATPTACTFSIFATAKNESNIANSGTARWHLLQTVHSFSASSDGSYPTSIAFDSSLFNDGLVQLRVQVNTTLPSLKYYQSKAFVLRNQGLQLCFNTTSTASSGSAAVLFPQAATTRLFLHNCDISGEANSAVNAIEMTLQEVSFFLETSQGTEVTSTFLSTYTGAALPIQIAIDPAHLAALSGGASVTVRAAVQSFAPALNATFSTAAMYAGIVQLVSTSQASAHPLPTSRTTFNSLIKGCSSGYFGLHNDSCTPCSETVLNSTKTVRDSVASEANSRGYFPQGFTCPAAGAVFPLASPGWYVQYERVPSLRCSANSQKQSAVCPAAWPCDPPEACLGGNTCSALYTGERCAECASGMLRVNQKCVSCDATYYGLLLLAVFVVIYEVFIIWNNACTKVLLRCYIGVDFVQLLSLLSTVTLTASTPTFVHTALNALTLLNLNPFLLVSSCLGIPYAEPQVIFENIFIAVNILPIAIAILLAGIHVLKSWSVDSYMIVLAAVLSLLYCLLLATSLAVFDCTTTTPDDNYYYLAAVGPMQEGRCWVEGEVQESLVPFAVLCVILYGLGIPVYLCGLFAYMRSCTDDCALLASTHHVADVRGETVNSTDDTGNVQRVALRGPRAETVRGVRWLLCTVIRKGAVLTVLYFTHFTSSSSAIGLAVVVVVVVVVLGISFMCVGRKIANVQSVGFNALRIAKRSASIGAWCLASKYKEQVLIVLSMCATLVVLALSLVGDSSVCWCAAVLLIALLCITVIYALLVSTTALNVSIAKTKPSNVGNRSSAEDCEVGEARRNPKDVTSLNSLVVAQAFQRIRERPASLPSAPLSPTAHTLSIVTSEATPLPSRINRRGSVRSSIPTRRPSSSPYIGVKATSIGGKKRQSIAKPAQVQWAVTDGLFAVKAPQFGMDNPLNQEKAAKSKAIQAQKDNKRKQSVTFVNEEANWSARPVGASAVMAPSDSPVAATSRKSANGWSDMWLFGLNASDHPTPHSPTREAATLPPATPSVPLTQHSLRRSSAALSGPTELEAQQLQQQRLMRFAAPLSAGLASSVPAVAELSVVDSATPECTNANNISKSNQAVPQGGVEAPKGRDFRRKASTRLSKRYHTLRGTENRKNSYLLPAPISFVEYVRVPNDNTKATAHGVTSAALSAHVDLSVGEGNDFNNGTSATSTTAGAIRGDYYYPGKRKPISK